MRNRDGISVPPLDYGARLTQSETTIQNLKKVLAVNSQLNSTLDTGELLEIIMKTAAEVMQTHVSSLLLLDSSTGDLVFQVALGEKGGELKEKFRVKSGEGIAGSVAQTGKSLIVNDVSKDPRFAKRFDASTGFVTKSILCVPMNARGKIIGVLQAINPLSGGDFTGDDRELFEVFADQAAIAVENARMHSEILKQERAKQDLKIAHEIQQSILPDLAQMTYGIDIAARSLPARDVGGDFYDVIALDSFRVGILIGDVSGKGVPAALYMVRALSEFRFLAPKAENPAALITHLNKTLSNNTPFGMFVTLLYMVVDLSIKKLTFVSAGHHPILRYNTDTKKVAPLANTGGPPAGLADTSRYQQTLVPLTAGDVLITYTDGVTEGRNPAKEEYGLKRLEQAILRGASNASAYTKTILEDLKKFTQDADPHDDITVMAVRIP